MIMFHFWIEGHSMSIIEVDGLDVEPYAVDSINIHYSVLVRARNGTDHRWRIHANVDPAMFDVPPPYPKLNYTSVLTYGNESAHLAMENPR
ncbi:multicopper oxidase [Malassezia pachydermatis]|uniref:Multicopper oxidase n=1 Tax=Malassezia pachydermatis TaxID=77020 RepID=A0A0M8MQS2_9BASI|nr:multicopper oxidase [Malassezia pachydermatis]KOS12424.1 multicopper oxidase [Malassezia pachydermatis]